MQPSGPVRLSNAIVTLPRATALISNWQVGQIIAATVASDSRSGQVSLRIGNQFVQARTTGAGLSHGQKLDLQVVELGRIPSLRILTPGSSDAVRAALRSALPRQQPVSGLLSELVRIAAQPAGLKPAVADATGKLLARSATQSQLTNPEGLRQAIRDSGHFLESRLAGATGTAPGLSRDMKANLLRLLSALRQSSASIAPEFSSPRGQPRPTAPAGQTATQTDNRSTPAPAAKQPAANQAPAPAPRSGMDTGARVPVPKPGLIEHTEAALARIRVNQLSSTAPERPLTPDWLLEIPVRRGEQFDTWSFQIQQHPDSQARDGVTESRWSVVLRFELPGSGPMEARIGLVGDTVSTTFIAEQDATLPVLKTHFSHLQDRLENQGLSVARLECFPGAIKPPLPPGARSGLVDEQV